MVKSLKINIHIGWKTVKDNPRFMTLNELASFGIGQKTLRKWYKSGDLKASTYVGTQPRFKYKDLEAAADRIRRKTEEKKAEKAGIKHPRISGRNKDEIIANIEKEFLN